MALCLGFPFAIWHRPLSALSTNWCINAMLWVTQWERGRESELERPKERGRGRERERDAGWIWMRQTQGGNEALGEASTEWERMEGQGKSFQLHKWLRAAWQNDEWRGKKKKPSCNGLFFFFSWPSLYPFLSCFHRHHFQPNYPLSLAPLAAYGNVNYRQDGVVVVFFFERCGR